MTYCETMNRPCSCGKLSAYGRDGRMVPTDNKAGCLSDDEIRTMLAILLQEWRRRSSVMEAEIALSLRQFH